MFVKFFAGTSVALLVGCIAINSYYQKKLFSAQVDIMNLTSQLDILTQSHSEQKEAIDKLEKSNSAFQERVRLLGEKNDAANTEIQNALFEIQKLRSTEQERAFSKPFERGNASTLRIRNNIMRIVREEANYN